MADALAFKELRVHRKWHGHDGMRAGGQLGNEPLLPILREDTKKLQIGRPIHIGFDDRA